jgi:hypothetical protein
VCDADADIEFALLAVRDILNNSEVMPFVWTGRADGERVKAPALLQ